MADSDTKNGGYPSPRVPSGARERANLRETVLLSELPEPTAPAPPEASPSNAANLNLSTNALAALGQRYEILARPATAAWAMSTKPVTARLARRSP